MEAAEKKKLQQFSASARRRRAAVHCKGRQPWTMFDGAHSCCCCRNTKIQKLTVKEKGERPWAASVRWSTHQPLVQLLRKNTKKKYNLGAIIGQILYSAAGKIPKKKNTNTIFDGAHNLLSGGGAAAAICNFPFNLPFFLIAWIHLRRRKKITRIHGRGSTIVTFATFFEPWMLSGTFSYEWTTLCGTFS